MYHSLLRTGFGKCVFNQFVTVQESLVSHQVGTGLHTDKHSSIRGGSIRATAFRLKRQETLRFPRSMAVALSTLMMILIVSLFSLTARKLRAKLANQALEPCAPSVLIVTSSI